MGFRQRLSASPFARLAAFPIRARIAFRHLGNESLLISKWLFVSKEHTNFTYDLSPRNVHHLAWWVSGVTGASIDDCRNWVFEALDDEVLKEHVIRATKGSDRRGLADVRISLARRAGWYAIVRATQPQHVVETGTDKGLGSLALAAALLMNGKGRLTTIDINPAAGYLISGEYAYVTDLVFGDSVAAISSIGSNVDLFIHDSDHSAEHESREIRAIEEKLSPHAYVLSDNAHATNSLLNWAESTGRCFSYFQEQPQSHWYEGAGIGAAWLPTHQ